MTVERDHPRREPEQSRFPGEMQGREGPPMVAEHHRGSPHHILNRIGVDRSELRWNHGKQGRREKGWMLRNRRGFPSAVEHSEKPRAVETGSSGAPPVRKINGAVLSMIPHHAVTFNDFFRKAHCFLSFAARLYILG
jgi:hypothetical protein